MTGLWNDPDHPYNGPAYHTGKMCIGTGVICYRRPAGTYWSPLLCAVCNAYRMDEKQKRLWEISASWRAKVRLPEDDS